MKYSIIVAAALALASGVAHAETQMTGDSGATAGATEGTNLSPVTGGENAVTEGVEGGTGELVIIKDGDGDHADEDESGGEHSEGSDESHGEHSGGEQSGGEQSGGDHSGGDRSGGDRSGGDRSGGDHSGDDD